MQAWDASVILLTSFLQPKVYSSLGKRTLVLIRCFCFHYEKPTLSGIKKTKNNKNNTLSSSCKTIIVDIFIQVIRLRFSKSQYSSSAGTNCWGRIILLLIFRCLFVDPECSSVPLRNEVAWLSMLSWKTAQAAAAVFSATMH